MRVLRAWLESPIADHDRRRAFAAAAAALLLAAVALTLIADPPDHPPTTPVEPQRSTRPGGASPRQLRVPVEALNVARRFVDGYLAHLYGHRRAHAIPGASVGLRRRLSVRPIRVTPAMRRQHPHVERIDGQQLSGGWLIEARVAADTVSFPIAVVVADRPGGLVVTRVVED